LRAGLNRFQMRVVEDNTARGLAGSSVVTIGNFDGVHLGHQALIWHCVAVAGEGRLAALVTFDPLPQAFFRPHQPPALLCSTARKLELAEQAGMDLAWVMRFNQELAQMPAADFAEKVLVAGLGADRVVVGTDFRFGRKREGDLSRLRELGGALGFAVDSVDDVSVDGHRVSSTRVRALLAQGDFAAAERCLGRPYTTRGTVVRGQRLGRELGYPTANMLPEALPSPVSGVFAVRARIAGAEEWRPAVASLGVRPAVGGSEFLVEVHIFDFDADLYGQQLEVLFVDKIRDEEDFPGMAELVAQMQQDEQRVRAVLKD